MRTIISSITLNSVDYLAELNGKVAVVKSVSDSFDVLIPISLFADELFVISDPKFSVNKNIWKVEGIWGNDKTFKARKLAFYFRETSPEN